MLHHLISNYKVDRERAAITDVIEAWFAGQRERSREAKVSRP